MRYERRGYPRPVSPRTRVRLLVAAAALAAAGVAVGATLMGGDDGAAPEATSMDRGRPVLELGLTIRDDATARALRAAERAYDAGDAAAARAQFGAILAEHPDSLDAAVGAAVASGPDGTVPRLRALVERAPDSGLVRLHLGLALYVEGDDAGATMQWQEALRVDPDTPAALRAEDLLFPNMVEGRPFFYAPLQMPRGLRELPPDEQIEALERRARSRGVGANLLYGAALQRAGRPISAAAAFGRALELDGDNLTAQIADAVGRFEKANPSAAFSRLGGLTESHPRSPMLRFHLGFLLLWIGRVEEAQIQLKRAVDANPRGLYAREARKLLSRLEEIRT